jgi:steroid 5-alpha reductase family enzyme
MLHWPWMISLAIIFFPMFFLWLYSCKTHNAGIIDVGWAALLTLQDLLLCLLFFSTASFSSEAKTYTVAYLILFTLLFIWHGRLAFYLWIRYRSQPEDARYTEIKKEWGGEKKFWKMFAFQGLLLSVVTTAHATSYLKMISPWNGNPFDAFFLFFGLFILSLGVIGEIISDQQLKSFKANPQGSKVCRRGLWNYSRHPNYFFEFLAWCGFALTSIHVSFYLTFLYTFIAPALMLYLLLYVTGVAPSEKRMREQLAKGEKPELDSYFKEVSLFIPRAPLKK